MADLTPKERALYMLGLACGKVMRLREGRHVGTLADLDLHKEAREIVEILADAANCVKKLDG